jgi:hypothetical protein
MLGEYSITELYSQPKNNQFQNISSVNYKKSKVFSPQSLWATILFLYIKFSLLKFILKDLLVFELRAGKVAQVIECLPSKGVGLEFKPQYTNNNKKQCAHNNT